MIAMRPALLTLPEEAVQRASEPGGRWERECIHRKMVGFRVDHLGWVNRKVPLRPWHLVARHEWKETNHAHLSCRALAGGAASVEALW